MDIDPEKAPMTEVGEANFEPEVLKSKLPVVVAFWAPWSRPCQILQRALAEVAVKCAGSVKVVKVNADDNPELSMWYDVQSIPTLLFFVDGLPRATVVGTASREAIVARLRAVCQGQASRQPSQEANHEHERPDL